MTQAEIIYAAYPRKEKRPLALKAIQKALGKVGFEELLEAVKEYAECRKGQDSRFTPLPASWFNAERWTDDRSQWRLKDGSSGRPGFKSGGASRIDDSTQDDAILAILSRQETA